MSSSMAGGLGAVNAAVRRESKGVARSGCGTSIPLWCLTRVSPGNADGGRRGSHGQGGGPMGKAAKTGRKRPGLTRRMIRSTLRVGMLATAVLVGRKTAGGGKARDGQATRSGGSAAPQGPGAAAGGQPPPEHTTSPAATGDGDRGRQAEQPQQIPPKGWLAIAKRTAKEVKADQVPLLSEIGRAHV